jgi:signal transduction histidine kinase
MLGSRDFSSMIKPELIGSLLGLVTHDLRNPLSALHSNAGFLSSVLKSEDRETREALEDMVASCDSLSHIIDNLELMALSIDARASRERTRLVLQECLAEAANRSRLCALSHRVELAVEPFSGAELKVSANREMLMRALSNLLRNAVQHSSEGSRVLARIESDVGRAVVRVEDSGVMLAPEHRTHAFTADGQLASKSMIGGRYGRGLGLLCAAMAAELCGAEIASVDSQSGKGNVFELRLPLI